MYAAREKSQFNFELINFICNNLLNQAGVTYINKPFILLIIHHTQSNVFLLGITVEALGFIFFRIFNDV
ncbi:hypothetical protein KPSB59_4260009 [Klebsiella quasipneumoniae subsp. quasipneumoniae]|nr:hypothetical protein KPSB59_4260009 [Klebsiella quasipneumoniae subsp. quasipneumoniae]